MVKDQQRHADKNKRKNRRKDDVGIMGDTSKL